MSKSKTNVTVISKISERPSTRDAALVVIYGVDLGRKYDLLNENTLIGRSSKADIQIDEDSISRNHAKIELAGHVATIADLGSTNGTFVNDEPVGKGLTLRNGDFIKIGRTIFKYLAGGNIEGLYYEEIYRLTTVDGLTQAFNKRYFVEALEREVSRSHRYGRPLSLVMIDVDHFKKINDTFGHLAGDHVLKSLSAALRPQLRREDIFARYGGEEFAVLLPEVELEGAVAVAEKLRKRVEVLGVAFEEQAIPVAISCGVAVLGELRDPMKLVKAADEQLYRAKQGGRNRVCAPDQT